jgi:hypothetical protein
MEHGTWYTCKIQLDSLVLLCYNGLIKIEDKGSEASKGGELSD